MYEYKDYETKKKDLIKRRDEMKTLLDAQQESEEVDKKDLYLINTLYKLLSMSVECDQLFEPTKITECKRVIKIRRSLPLEILRETHPELIVFEGVFMTHDCVIIPHDIMRKIGFYSRKMKNTDILPEGYCYSTLKDVGNFGIALKESEVTRQMNFSDGWEFFNLNLS